jgi:hypothetical protein
LLLSLATYGHLTLVDTVALPVDMNGDYIRAAYWANPPNDSLVFAYHVYSEKEGDSIASIRYDAATKTVSRLPGWDGFQKSCDDGIASV